MDSCDADPELGVLVAEREQLRHRAELPRDVLTDRELQIAALSGQGVPEHRSPSGTACRSAASSATWNARSASSTTAWR
jgi:hypothetical protein